MTKNTQGKMVQPYQVMICKAFFTIYYQNVNGLNTKVNNFVEEVYCNNYDIIAIAKSWFKCDSEYPSQLFNKYNAFITDRITQIVNKTRRGSSCLFIHKKYQCQEIKVPFNNMVIIVGYLRGNGIQIPWWHCIIHHPILR